MKRVILFSDPNELVLSKIKPFLFPKEFESKVFAYMPADGAKMNAEFEPIWRDYTSGIVDDFIVIDNSLRGEEAKKECEKLLKANILMITGGNTFQLLMHLKESGLDKAIQDLAKKDDFVVAGFSAGALILTANIKICNLPTFDNNEVGLEDLTGLGLVDFEIFPHYSEKFASAFKNYKLKTNNQIKCLTDGEFLIHDNK